MLRSFGPQHDNSSVSMTDGLRVFIVDHAPIFGGVEAMINDLVGAVDRKRFVITVVTDTASQVEFSNVDVRRIPMPRLGNNPAAMVTTGLRLSALARDADVMMTTTARTHAIGAVAAWLTGKPLVWRLADDTFPLLLARTLRRIPRRIIAVSSFIAGRCSPAPPKTVIIPDGLPDGARPFQAAAPGRLASPPHRRATMRRALGLAEDEVVAVIVARLVRWKGHTIFARAVKMSRVTGLIVGGEDESEGELGGRGLRAELESIGANVHFLGHRSDLQSIFAASDVFVHASTRPEPFGRSVVQAMLAGLPVIATRAGAIPEVVGDAGRLVPAGDAGALAAALTMDAATRERLGRKGRERALARFELNETTRRLEQVWRDAAGL